MAFIDSTALNVGLPAIQASLHASGAQLLWIVNAYLLMLAALILLGGALGDRIGRTKIFAVGIGLFLLASLACGLAPNIEFLIAGRVLQGLGGALMIPGSLSLIGASFAADRRGRAIGTWSSFTTLVTIAGPALGGVLADSGLWRAIFLINLPLGLAALLALLFKVPAFPGSDDSRTIDYAGAVLASLGLAGLAYGFISAPDYGFAHPRVLAALLGGTAALAIFVVVEARSQHPLMPLSLFRSRTFSGTNLLTLFLYAALSTGTFFLSLNLVQAQGYSQALAGFAFTPFGLILAALSRWTGSLADRHGPRLPLIAGPALAGLGLAIWAFTGLTAGPASYWTTFFPGIVVFGLGMAITVAPLTAAVMGSAGVSAVGAASGINNAVARIAGVLALAILGALALVLFAGALERHTAALPLSGPARAALQRSAAQLGGADVPPEVGIEQTAAVRLALRQAFVDMFRVVLLICAALAWVSAAMAALFVHGHSIRENS